MNKDMNEKQKQEKEHKIMKAMVVSTIGILVGLGAGHIVFGQPSISLITPQLEELMKNQTGLMQNLADNALTDHITNLVEGFRSNMINNYYEDVKSQIELSLNTNNPTSPAMFTDEQ